MNYKKELLNNLNKIHTTELGIERIKKNLSIKTDDVIQYCVEILKKEDSKVWKKGKNYYLKYNDIIITINSSSFTVITAHKK